MHSHPSCMGYLSGKPRTPGRDFNVTRVPLAVLMWKVRGINAEKKQRYLDWLVSEQ